MIHQVLNLGSLLLTLGKFAKPDSKDINDADRILTSTKQTMGVLSTGSKHKSAARAVISPMVGIEDSLIHQEYANELMTVIQLRDIMATITHLALENAGMVGIKIGEMLGGVQPNRSGMMALAGLEALNDNAKNKKTNNEDKQLPGGLVTTNSKSSEIMEYSPLAVGKVVNVTLHGDNNQKIDIPLTFRQIPMPMSFNDLKLVFSASKVEDGFFARILMKKVGEITTPELLTGKDIIKQKFKIENEELSGYYKEAIKRETQNKVEAIKSQTIGFNNLANAFVISSDTANQLELMMGRRFNDPRARQKIYECIKANTIVVCNEDRGVFRFYTDGNDLPEDYTRKDLTIKSKQASGSNSLQDLVKLLKGA